MSTVRLQRLTLPLVACGAALALLTAIGAGQALLPIAPLILLFVSLLLDRYPGAAIIARLGERLAGGRRRRSAKRVPRPPLFRASFASGGLLVAMALSGRAPPA